jgi:hypothetical protein
MANPTRPTPHATDAAGAAPNLSAIVGGSCVPPAVLVTTVASSAADANVRRQIDLCDTHTHAIIDHRKNSGR